METENEESTIFPITNHGKCRERLTYIHTPMHMMIKIWIDYYKLS